MNENVKIKKAKIKDDLFLEVEYVETLPHHSKKDTKLSCTVPIHDDLKASFERLHKHLAIICDEVKTPTKGKYDQEDYPGFSVRGFSIGGNDENEGITISGSKEGQYGTVNLNTPFTKFDTSDYPFASQLGEDVQLALNEIDLYLFEGKKAPERQLEMDFDADAGETEDTNR